LAAGTAGTGNSAAPHGHRHGDDPRPPRPHHRPDDEALRARHPELPARRRAAAQSERRQCRGAKCHRKCHLAWHRKWRPRLRRCTCWI